jgi:hypothetical protein
MMGILSWVFPLLGPFVWYYAQRMLGDIDKSPTRIENREAIAAGRTLAATVTVLTLLAPLVVLFVTMR